MIDLLARRLLFVTGKGGVGKTTVAAALGLLASESGLRTLVCEVEPKGDLSFAYECGPTPFQGRQVARNLVAMSMDTEASLREYLHHVARVPVVGRIGPVARAFDFVATAAPGIREILTIGKLCYEVREDHYDLVVVDAAATGHVVGQLAAPTGINELVRVGVVRSQTDWMLEILRNSRQTGVVLVTTPEEMPVSEAVDLAGRLATETPVHLACVIANRVLPELFGRAEEQVFDALTDSYGTDWLAQRLEVPPAEVASVLGAARLAVTVRRDGSAHLERLREAIGESAPLLYLPYLFSRAHGMRAIRQVAQSLKEEL
ncbi:MAG: ArsA family ATPase [Acidimicrobiales bacterium]